MQQTRVTVFKRPLLWLGAALVMAGCCTCYGWVLHLLWLLLPS